LFDIDHNSSLSRPDRLPKPENQGCKAGITNNCMRIQYPNSTGKAKGINRKVRQTGHRHSNNRLTQERHYLIGTERPAQLSTSIDPP
jgi:hypothetical protein